MIGAPGRRPERGALLLLACLGLCAATPEAPEPVADPPEALVDEPQYVLNDIQREFYEEALALERHGRFGDAAIRYRIVANQVPNWSRARLDQGRVLEQDGRPEAALEAYALLPHDADAVEASGTLLEALGRWSEAAEAFRRLRNLRPEWPGARLLEARCRARLEPDLAAGLIEDYLTFEGANADDPVLPAVVVTAVALRDRGEHTAAKGLLQDVLARFPELPELKELVTEIEVDEAARALAEASDLPLDSEQVARLQLAREAFAAGRTDEARRELEVLVIEQPLSAIAWSTLADVREEAGDIRGAHQAVAAAERLDPVSATYPEKLGDLLFAWYGGRYDVQAAEAYGRAALRRPEDASLWYRKAIAERRSGNWARALPSFEQVLALEPEGPRHIEAQRAVDGIAREQPQSVVFPSHPRPIDVPEAAWWAYHRARAWTQRPEADASARALSELAAALAIAPDYVDAIDLEATIREERGELEAATGLFERSLALEPDRGWVVGRLAGLYHRIGRVEDAAASRERAAALGDPDALWRLAQAQYRAGRWSEARTTLARFFAHTAGGPAYGEALELDAALSRKIRAARLGIALGALGVLFLPLALRWRRRAGAPLQALIDQAPQSWREVARICSAIRHEVLKHRTSVLESVAVAIEEGDPEPARWAAERLFGPGQALDRLDGYLRELESLGRAHGVHLNLAVRDPVLSPLIAHARRLRRSRRAMIRGRKRRLADELRSIARGMNRDAVRGLGRLVAGLCVLEVDERLLRSVCAAVREEPAFLEQDLPEIEVEIRTTEPLYVRMFRSDLQDVLVNLLRNAVQASLTAGADRIRLVLDVEEDEVTALDSAVIRVCDQAPSRLTTARLRGRYVARGLGLAMDLTNRAGGSIRVEPIPGWGKALVVRLPRAEVPADDG